MSEAEAHSAEEGRAEDEPVAHVLDLSVRMVSSSHGFIRLTLLLHEIATPKGRRSDDVDQGRCAARRMDSLRQLLKRG